MRNLSALKWLPLLLLPLLLSSCATPPPDVPVFENLTQHLGTDPKTGHLILKPSPVCAKEIGEVECGHGVYIMSKKEIFVGEKPEHLFHKKPWSQLKRESVYVPAQESYAPLSTYVINACKQMNCDDQINRFKIKIDSLGSIGAALNPEGN